LKPNQDQCDTLFLPDFCGIRMVFVVVIIAELAALVLALAPLDIPWHERWSRLGLISLFVQWCALASCALLCVLRRPLCRFSNIQAGILSYVVVLLVIALVGEAAYWLVHAPSGYPTDWHLKFQLRNLLIGLLITGPILRYFYVQHQWRRNVQAEAAARLQALQSRIRPHFLFNSMNTIASLTRSNPEQAETVVENLADLFRASLSDARERLTLRDELALCRRYLDIEKLRLGERLQIDWQPGPIPEDLLVPALILQPLLENAIYHGIEPRTEGGTLSLHGECRDGQLLLRIRNPLPATRNAASNGNRLALDNTRERLAVYFNHAARLQATETDTGYEVLLTLPSEFRHEDSDR
jgi:two-component system sensor histidine kinase AlgZ